MNPNETTDNVANPLAARQAAAQGASADAHLPATTGSAPLARRLDFAADSGMEGDFSERDLQLPRLNMVQATGPLANDWTPGQLLLARQVVLAACNGKEPSPEVDVSVINITKGFEERTEYDEDVQGRRFATEQEVRDAGFTLESSTDKDGKKVKSTAYPTGRLLLLLRRPKDVAEDLFGTHIVAEDGVNADEVGEYTVVLWNLKGTGYPAFKTLVTRAFAMSKGRPARRLLFQNWGLSFKKEQWENGNSGYVPTFRTKGIHSEAFVKLVLEQFQGM